jgi:UTP--glucose-1-phosphate uridylyltransferase
LKAKPIGRAVIPAAGRGTRMLPISSVVPKEMLPIGTRPMIEFAVAEAASAGISEIFLVIAPEKRLIPDYFRRRKEEGEYPGVRFRTVTQPEPLGLADAIERCREELEGEPFGLLLPDNVILAPEYRFSSLLRAHQTFGQDVVGVIELQHRDSGRWGNAGRIDYDEMDERTVRIRRLYDKEKDALRIGPGERLLRTCGRYVCHSDIFSFFDEVRPRVSGEFDEVPVYQEVVRQRGMIGCRIPMPLVDVGNPLGYLTAQHLMYLREALAAEDES